MRNFSNLIGSTKRKRSQQGPSSKVARMTVGEKDSADGVLTLDDQDELIENDSQDDSNNYKTLSFKKKIVLFTCTICFFTPFLLLSYTFLFNEKKAISCRIRNHRTR